MNMENEKDVQKSKEKKLDKSFALYNLGERISFPHAFVVLDGKLYFTTVFNNLLYEVDLKNYAFKEYCLPRSEKRIPAYRQAVAYQNKVIFVPEYEDFFVVFEEGDYHTVISKGNYASCVAKNEKLFLLDRGRSCVDVFDMEACNYEGEYALANPEHIADLYIDLVLDKDSLYATSGVERRITKIDLLSGGIEHISTDAIICHGALEDGRLYYTATKEDLDGIYCFDFKRGVSEKVANIEYDNKNKVQYYRFWNPKKIGKYICFCPHEESKIIRYNIEMGTVDYISAFDAEYKSLRPDESKAVYGMETFGDVLIVMPYFGDEISIMNMDGSVRKNLRFCVSLDKISEFFAKYICDNEVQILSEVFLSIEEYIGVILCGLDGNELHKANEPVGKIIYEKLGESCNG